MGIELIISKPRPIVQPLTPPHGDKVNCGSTYYAGEFVYLLSVSCNRILGPAGGFSVKIYQDRRLALPVCFGDQAKRVFQ